MKKEVLFLSVVTWMAVKSVHCVGKSEQPYLTPAITVNVSRLHGRYSLNLWVVSAEEWLQIRRYSSLVVTVLHIQRMQETYSKWSFFMFFKGATDYFLLDAVTLLVMGCSLVTRQLML